MGGVAPVSHAQTVSPQTLPADRTGPAAKRKAQVDFTGIVALDNCSGSLVRGPRTADTDAALVLTNGHCLETGMPQAGQVLVNRPSTRTFTLLDSSGQRTLGTLRATRMEYATMTDTDVALYRLDTSYARLAERYGTRALRLSLSRPRVGTDIRVVSGYWRTIYSCKIDGIVDRLREAQWTWRDSIRYTSSCDTIGGTSGSPVVDAATGRVVGINNTGNENGERCTLNNPCEIVDGRVTVRPGADYGQQTYQLARCLGRGNDVVLTAKGCTLPRPSAR
ncbi:MAG: trypsin-like peptidase domain-containing protein [Actinomadura rubrobrunea]|nr:trypsin-like peptidase domain-containing protein [Actinomadura rubrobrunea]